MARIDRLSVILSDALPQLRSHEEPDLPNLPALESLLRAGRLSALWSPAQLECARIDPWQLGLLHALGAVSDDGVWASAALSWHADGVGEFETCLHAEPVHLAAGMDHLQLFPIADLDAEEAQTLHADLHSALATVDLELRIGRSGRWYATAARRWDLATYSPRSRFAAQVYEIMPRGSDGPKLRRLMTELQMFLHAHPLNIRRERQGLRSVNAVWFWGRGALGARHQPVSPQRVFSEQPFARGLCDYLKIDCSSTRIQADDLLAQAEARSIAVIEPMPLPELDAQWLQKIESALRRGLIRRLEIVLDHRQILVDGDIWSRLKRPLKRSGGTLKELLA